LSVLLLPLLLLLPPLLPLLLFKTKNPAIPR
jgi:hypothetical protein